MLHERLSVFWGTPSTLQGRLPGGRFPALDKLDLIENGRLLAGEDARHGLVKPTRTELLIAGAEFALDYLGGGHGSLGPPSPGLGSMSPADDSVLEELRSPALLAHEGPTIDQARAFSRQVPLYGRHRSGWDNCTRSGALRGRC